MSFTIKCDKCGYERRLHDEFLQLGHHRIDLYARDEGEIEIECIVCEKNDVNSGTV